MTEDQFKLGFATLVNTFIFAPGKITDATRDIYWQMLNEIPGDLWESGLQRCLRVCKFFPTIAELGEACLHGHLIERFKYNPHCYTEPKKLDWFDALQQVLQERRRSAQMDVLEEAEISPPPSKIAAKRILTDDLKPKFEELGNTAAVEFVQAAVDPEKRAREEKQREESAKVQKDKIRDQLKFLESQEKPKRQGRRRAARRKEQEQCRSYHNRETGAIAPKENTKTATAW
jgi:hypothetical protein